MSSGFDINLSQIPGALHLARPDWGVIRTWVEQHIAEPDRRSAWSEIAFQWLEKLDDALGGGYQAEQVENLILFAPRDHELAGPLLRSAETTLTEIEDRLGDVAGESWLRPLVILFFRDAEAYYSYVVQFYPDQGEFGGSAGMCISREGYVHIALQPHQTMASLEGTLTHEVTHACLAHLTLPAWVNEGIAKLAEETAWNRFTIDVDTADEVRGYWQEHGLQDFWWGTGFHAADEAQKWSYQLAQILTHLIASDHAEQFPQFVRHAHADDAGDTAARERLGIGVAELAAQFLGEGPWEPVPQDAGSCSRRGALRLARGKYSQAIADFDEAIKLDSQLADAHTNRALAQDRLRQTASAIVAYEKAIDLNAKDFHARNSLAWILATCPDDTYRDGDRAQEYAAKACELSGFDSWSCLGTLAAAYAELGDFQEARKWAKESLQRAPEEERAGCRERLQLYKDKIPYREPPKPA